MKRFKEILKNQRGLTLVELLAVIVILGIIAAIAVPSIGKIIDNSKKDAHIANAEQLVAAARLAQADQLNQSTVFEGSQATVNNASISPKNGYNFEQLVEGGYLESLIDPDSSNKAAYTDGYVEVVKDTNNRITYKVFLDGAKYDIGSNSNPVLYTEITREDVK
ncbi:type II secretion system protein [Bacillus sp. V5-8f]|uniref:type II secretion system protein n=1 Tax=Bacillus sp. V5-8f TaxID=2053044 RepID=UPI000C78002F|nr:type II secretion system protein [Bacillus sp. V5-8f]PLT32391.1 prepilin-type cleavage/methylation domain-containing protein [Bacillus sp. V5-8f]